MTENKKIEKNKLEEKPSLLSKALVTGFYGGLIWSGLGVFMYYFNFSEVAPKTYLLRSWIRSEWTSGWLGDCISIVMTGVISILVAFIYYSLLKKKHSLWIAVSFGIVLWAIVFYVIKPIFTNVPPLLDLSKITIVSTVCLYILYGTFIGYTISYDYEDRAINDRLEQEES